MPVQYETPQTIFDSRASQYDHKRFRRFMYKMLDHAVINAVPKVKSYPQAILDVGCGTGRFLGLMEKQFPQTQLTGVDVSPGMINIAKRKVASNPLFDFHVASADKLPPSFNNSFDLAFSIISFHYWKRPIVSLREINRVVRPGGFFILADGFVTEGLLGSLPRVYFKLFSPTVVTMVQ